MENRSSAKEKLHRCLILFYTFAKIAAFVVGGGYAILPVVQETFCSKYKWLAQEELLDMVGLVQTIPGIIACNCAVYVGLKVAGLLGVVFSVIGVCLPSVLVIMLIAAFFPDLSAENPFLTGMFAGVRVCVTALLFWTFLKMVPKVLKNNAVNICIFLVAFFLLISRAVRPVFVMSAGLLLGCAISLYKVHRGGEERKEKQ